MRESNGIQDKKVLFAGRTKKRLALVLALAVVCTALAGCGDKKSTPNLLNGEHVVEVPTDTGKASPAAASATPGEQTPTDTVKPTPEDTPAAASATPTGKAPTEAPTPTDTPTPKPTETPAPTDTPTPKPTESVDVPTPTPNGSADEAKLVVIDAGHQRKGNNDKEPDGPGSTTMKAKVSSGTTGHFTGIPEYELNLIVAKKLEAILLERGYRVIMVRDTHDVDISNSERAEVANRAGADAFVRIHANANDNSDVNGAETLCQTKNNPYNAALYTQSRRLSEAVLDALCAECGCKKRHVVETDTMSGINWCSVPVTIVEMGFMTNEKEDKLMATEEYRDKLAKGIADGIDAYFAGN